MTLNSAQTRRPSRFAALIAALGVVTLVSMTTACSPIPWVAGAGGVLAFAPSRLNHLYNTQYQRHVPQNVEAGGNEARLGFIEADDHGWLRDTLQARAILDDVQALHANRNVVVVVYVHGWRHNASRKDHDVNSFTETIHYLAHQLNTPELQRRRTASELPDPHMLVYGVYVGWRGKAWPEASEYVPIPVAGPVLGLLGLDWPVYLTTFGRKEAAEAVGRGDVRQFLLRLDDMHRQIFALSRQGKARPFGLVIVGHSYGGQVVFDAVSGRVEDNMASAIAGISAERAGMANRLYPRLPLAPAQKCLRRVAGVGDLVVLVNPAVEASAYRRIDGMVRSTRFRTDQLPVLITVTAVNDWARKWVFPIMRTIQHGGEPGLGGDQNHFERLALGVADEHVTDELVLTDPTTPNIARAKLGVVDKKGRAILDSLYLGSEPPLFLSNVAVANPDTCPHTTPLFTGHDIGIIRMKPVPGMDARPMPALMFRSSKDIVGGHSDFFRAEFINWLTSYVIQIEDYRLADYRCRKKHPKGSEPDSDDE